MKQIRNSILMLPLLVFVLFFVVACFSLFYSDWLERKRLIAETTVYALDEAGRLARLAGRLSVGGAANIFPLEQEILQLRSEKSVLQALVVDEDGRIVAARERGWQGLDAPSLVADWDAPRLLHTLRSSIADIRVDTENMRVSVLAPFAGALTADETGMLVAAPMKVAKTDSLRRGAVLLVHDLSGVLQRQRKSNFIRRLPDLSMVLLFAIGLAFWIYRSVVAPLRSITEASRRIGDGDLSARAPISETGEVAELGNHFNHMAEALERELAERLRSEASLRLSASVFETTGEAITVTDVQGKIVMVNPAFCRITGYREDEVLGQTHQLFDTGRHDRDFFRSVQNILQTQGQWKGEVWSQRKNGEQYPEWQNISVVRDQAGQISHYVTVFADLTEIRKAQEEAETLSWRDPLTNLANRALFLQELGQTLGSAQRDGGHASVLLIDIDRFKDINEARGLAMGDALLKAVAERLARALRPDDVLARLNADEFAIILPRLAETVEEAGREALAVAEKLRTIMLTSVVVDDETFHLDASVGIAILPDSSEETASDILRRADMAMHGAKDEGGARIIFFEEAMGDAVRERFRLERELRLAIVENQLRLYLQPQVDATGQSVGCEALVRWQHPQRGLVPPGMFIPLAESSELIVTLDRWMLAEVCRLLAQLKREGQPLRISVNISPRHFRREDFVEEVRRLLAASGADARYLMLEITEGMVIGDINDVVAKMQQLMDLGIQFSMDDFGTGYSSLAYLKRLPIHELKIDKGFIQDATSDANDAALVETILSVAQHMKLQVVAEGVETQEQADFLNARASVIHQGYLFGRPEPVDSWLARHLSKLS